MKLNSNGGITLNSIKIWLYIFFDELSVKRACAKTTGPIQLKIAHSFYHHFMGSRKTKTNTFLGAYKT